MNCITVLLERLREYEIEKYDTEREFKEEIERLIAEKYHGDSEAFINNEILNEDYGTLLSVVEGLLKKEYFIS